MTRAVRDFLSNLDAIGALDAGGTIVTVTNEDAQHIAQNLRDACGMALRRKWRIVSVHTEGACEKLNGVSAPVVLAPSFYCAPDAVRHRVTEMIRPVNAMMPRTAAA